MIIGMDVVSGIWVVYVLGFDLNVIELVKWFGLCVGIFLNLCLWKRINVFKEV